MGTGRHRRRLAGGALLLGSIGLIGVAQPASAAATPGVVGVLPTVTSPVYDPGVGVYAAGLASVDLINGLSVTSSTALPFATGAIGVDTGANDVYALNQPLAKKGEIGIVHNMALATTIVVKGAHPTALAVDSTAHLAYVTEITASAGQVAVLDGTSVVGTVPLAAQPYAVDVDPSSGLAYVACGNNTVVVLHGTTVVGSVAVPNLPVDVVADPVNGDAYVESLPGPAATLTVLHGTTVAGSIPLGANVSNVAVDTTSGSVYVGDAVDDTSVSVVNGTTLTTTVELGAPSTSITVDPAAGVAYVQVGTDLVPISGGVAGPPFPLPVPSLVSVSGFLGGAADPSTGDLYVDLGGQIAVVRPVSATTVTTLSSDHPSGVAWGQPVTLTATVTASDGSTPTGTVSFYLNLFGYPPPLLLPVGVPLGGPVNLSGGQASVTTSGLPGGSAVVIAVFTSTGGTQALSGAELTQPVTSSTVTLLSPTRGDIVTAGKPTAFRARVYPKTTAGTVQFAVNGSDLGAPVTVAGGIAKISTAALPMGQDLVTATFINQSDSLPSSSDTVTVDVVP
ncbi:MAG TPA: Ig-like domain repeat protein [Acidimicrobiales bacterium]|nr:Ig-like domain repeat protein [Acidimicrobiales bacterium]